MPIDRTRLEEILGQVAEVASNLGLSLHPTHFELVDHHALYGIAAYGGMPVRYRHWSFGKALGHYQNAYDHRRSRIYEMVINHQPSIAFLDRSMEPARVKVVVAHVLAHVDYFHRHFVFTATASDQVALMAEHRREVDAYQRQFGRSAVERVIDAGLALADFTAQSPRDLSVGERDDDVLGIAIQEAPTLAHWQRRVLLMLHQEARYFWPQQLTKLGNEGYATFWHRRIIHAMSLSPTDRLEVARMNAELVAVVPPQLNPYRIGYVLVDRAYREQGLAGLARVAHDLTDMGLVREYLNADGVQLAGLSIAQDMATEPTTVPHWLKVKHQLLADLEHAGLPYIRVDRTPTVDTATFRLYHDYTGRDLDLTMAKGVLGLVATELWHGPVRLTMRCRGTTHRVTHNGRTFQDDVVEGGERLEMEREQIWQQHR